MDAASIRLSVDGSEMVEEEHSEHAGYALPRCFMPICDLVALQLCTRQAGANCQPVYPGNLLLKELHSAQGAAQGIVSAQGTEAANLLSDSCVSCLAHLVPASTWCRAQ